MYDKCTGGNERKLWGFPENLTVNPMIFGFLGKFIGKIPKFRSFPGKFLGKSWKRVQRSCFIIWSILEPANRNSTPETKWVTTHWPWARKWDQWWSTVWTTNPDAKVTSSKTIRACWRHPWLVWRTRSFTSTVRASDFWPTQCNDGSQDQVCFTPGLTRVTMTHREGCPRDVVSSLSSASVLSVVAPVHVSGRFTMMARVGHASPSEKGLSSCQEQH